MSTNGSTQPYPDVIERMAGIFNEQRPLPAYEQVKELAALQIELMQASHQATAVQQHTLGETVQTQAKAHLKAIEGVERQLQHQSHSTTQSIQTMQETLGAITTRLDALTTQLRQVQASHRRSTACLIATGVLLALAIGGLVLWRMPAQAQLDRIEGGIAHVMRTQQAIEQPVPPRKR